MFFYINVCFFCSVNCFLILFNYFCLKHKEMKPVNQMKFTVLTIAIMQWLLMITAILCFVNLDFVNNNIFLITGLILFRYSITCYKLKGLYKKQFAVDMQNIFNNELNALPRKFRRIAIRALKPKFK